MEAIFTQQQHQGTEVLMDISFYRRQDVQPATQQTMSQHYGREVHIHELPVIKTFMLQFFLKYIFTVFGATLHMN